MHGICNMCGGVARKRERAQGWAVVHVGVTQLQMHHECADYYRSDGLLPTATFRRTTDSLRDRVRRAMDEPQLRRRQPEGKLWFGAPPRDERPLNFH